MRLTCPNCGAQYEVPNEAISPRGRDVQCSNCDTVWFVTPPKKEDSRSLEKLIEKTGHAPVAQKSAPDALPPDDASHDVPAEAAVEDQSTVAAPEIEQTSEDRIDRPADTGQPESTDTSEPNSVQTTASEADESTTIPRRKLDPDVLNVLREEAAYEAQARQAERGTLETQPEFGLEPAAPSQSNDPMAKAQARLAELAHETQSVEEEEPRLEDTPHPQKAGPTPKEAVPPVSTDQTSRKTSRRRGFWWAVTLVALGAALYVYADEMAETAPGLAEPIDGYVAAVDTGRVWLDAQVLKALTLYRDLTANSGD